MHRPLHPLHALVAALAVAGTALSAPAHASTLLDFEDPDLTGLYFPGDSFEESGYQMTQVGDAGTIDTGGALGDAAPTNDATSFYSTQNEGQLHLSRIDGGAFDLDGFSAAYVPLLGSTAAPQTILLAVGWVYEDGDAFFDTFSLGDTSSTTTGSAFITYSGSKFADEYSDVVQVSFFACASDDGVNCNAALLQNNGQFALDDVLVTELAAPVPEPTSAALMALGLLSLVVTHRRGLARSGRGAR